MCKLHGSWLSLSALVAAPLLRNTPDHLGSYLCPQHPLLLDPYFYWSIGHKLYWLGFFSIGFFYGHMVPELIEKAPSWCKNCLQNRQFRVVAFVLAAWQAFALVSLDEPHDDSLEDSLADWPHFFNWAYPLKLLAECTQLVCLAVGVQQGGLVLRTLGASILGTFIAHMYLDTGIKAFAGSHTFELLRICPVLGGLLQLTVLLAYPVVFGLTVGRLTMYIFTLCFSRGSVEKGSK